MGFKINIGNGILLILHILSSIAGYISIQACYVSPEEHWFLSFIGLGFMVFVLVQIIFFIYWVLIRKIYWIISLLFFVFFWNYIQRSYNLNYIQANTEESGSMSIMTYNVKNFDLYDWNKGADTRKQMLQLIREEQPTIICLQEFYSSEDKNNFNNEKYLKDSLGYPYYYFSRLYEVHNESWGLAIYSHLPIINYANIEFDNVQINGAIYADMIFERDTFRVFNTHLQSFHFGEKELQKLQVIDDIVDNPEKAGSIKAIIRKMKNAFIKRSYQVKKLNFYIKESPYPVILAGDFNDSPVSYTYHQLGEQLQDAFVFKGKGFGRTFFNTNFAFRIDYLFFDKSMTINSYRTIDKMYSDHLPVKVNFNINE